MRKFNEWLKIRESFDAGKRLYGNEKLTPPNPGDPGYDFWLQQQAARNAIPLVPREQPKPAPKPATVVGPSQIDSTPTQIISQDGMEQEYLRQPPGPLKDFLLKMIRQRRPDFRG